MFIDEQLKLSFHSGLCQETMCTEANPAGISTMSGGFCKVVAKPESSATNPSIAGTAILSNLLCHTFHKNSLRFLLPLRFSRNMKFS